MTALLFICSLSLADANALRFVSSAPALSTSVGVERAIAGRRFPTQVRPLVGALAHTHAKRRGAHARRFGSLVVNVPLGADVAAAAGQVIEAGGGTVQLAAGTYNLTSTIPLGNNLTINGQGSSTIILSPQTPHGFAMMANVAEGIGNIVISNLVLDGNIPPGAFGSSLYNGAGIYIVALDTAVQPVTISNVEVRNTAIGLLLDGVNDIDVSNDYIHDNNPGFFSHNAYFIACTGVSISHSRFIHAHTGDGLHFDFGSSVYTISKSEFSGNNGIGILDQGGSEETVVDTIANGNQNDGFQMSSSGSQYLRDIASNDWGFGYNNGGGSGIASALAAFNDGSGFGQFFAYSFGNLLESTTPNQYLAILAQGATGADDTADWSTAYGGYSTVGEVDFNANHLTNPGLLVFDVGAVGAGNYAATIRYSNGMSSTLPLALNVNGVHIGNVMFPPTGSWSTWSTANVTLPLNDGNNVIRIRPYATGAPELDYLQVNTAVPAAPAAPATLTVNPSSPYAVKLTWSAVPGAQSYTIYRSGVPVALATGVLATHYTDTTILEGDSTYNYAVAAVNQGGQGPGTTSSNVTTPLDGPVGLQVSAASSGYTLTWGAANGATSYDIRRSTNVNGPYRVIANTTGTSYTDTTALPNEIYYYSADSRNATMRSLDTYELGVNLPSTGQLSQDIGTTGLTGFTDYNASTGVFGLSGSGNGLWSTADSFHFDYLPVSGDTTMTARVTYVNPLAAATQAGIDIRASLAPGAANALVAITGSLGAASIVRTSTGGTSFVNGLVPNIAPPYYIQMARSGNVFTSAISPDGTTWTNIGTATIPMPATVYVGLAGSSTVVGKATLGMFDSLTTQNSLTQQATPAALRHRFGVLPGARATVR
jgi:hypothetical protein